VGYSKVAHYPLLLHSGEPSARNSPGRIQLRCGSIRVELALDPQIFNLPLTLKWQVPGGWNSCQAVGDGKPLAIAAKGKTVLFDVPPETKSLRIEQK
jgi:hypothetical protein